jgi:hypothetical protein
VWSAVEVRDHAGPEIIDKVERGEFSHCRSPGTFRSDACFAGQSSEHGGLTMQKKLGSGDWDGWLMAIGIGMGFVALELAMLVASAATRPAATRYAAPAIICVTTSAAMHAFAFASHVKVLT